MMHGNRSSRPIIWITLLGFLISNTVSILFRQEAEIIFPEMNPGNSQIKQHSSNLSKTEVTKISQILENCVNQLRIIQCLKEKEEVGTNECNCWNFAIRTLLVVNEELKFHGTWKILEEILNHERAKREELTLLSFNARTLEGEIKRLESQLKEDNKKFQRELEDRNHVISEQNIELQAGTAQNATELQFEREWLKGQIEENDLKCELREAVLKNCIIDLKNDIDEEETVHEEIMWYYENKENNVDRLISYWKGRFKDIDEREVELEKLNEKQKHQQEELKFYKNLYTTRKKEMDEYLADKERRRQEYEYEQYRHREATKIQAWWRGVMVRRYLGPFKHLLKAKNIKKRKLSLKKIIKR